MTSAIGSSTKAAYTPPVAVAPQVKSGGTDSDGDNDGSKAVSAPAPKAPATTGTVGTIINTSA